MTTPTSILIRGPLPPLPEPRIVFSPGAGATFDGDRWSLPLVVLVEDDADRSRRVFSRTAIPDALHSVEDAAERRGAATIVLDGSDWLRSLLPESTVDRIEARLERTARAADAVHVVRTRSPPTPDDRDRYAAVIDRSDERTWRGASADPPRRRCSHSPDTGRRRPTTEP